MIGNECFCGRICLVDNHGKDKANLTDAVYICPGCNRNKYGCTCKGGLAEHDETYHPTVDVPCRVVLNVHATSHLCIRRGIHDTHESNAGHYWQTEDKQPQPHGERSPPHIVQAPMKYASSPRPWVFLSGSIAMGEAEYWQEEVAKELENCTILNPRRDDWDNSWKQDIADIRFREQVEWELQGLASVNLTLIYFDPETFAPITLLELGLQAGRGRPTFVCCPIGFYRRGNVEITCRQLNVPFLDTKDELIEKANDFIERYNGRPKQ